MSNTIAFTICACLILSMLLPSSHAQKSNQSVQKKIAQPDVGQKTATDLNDAVNEKRRSKPGAKSPVEVVSPNQPASQASTQPGTQANQKNPLSKSVNQEGISSSVVASGQVSAETGSVTPRTATGPVYKELPPLTAEQAEKMEEEFNEANPTIPVPRGENKKIYDAPIDPPTTPPGRTESASIHTLVNSIQRSPQNAAQPQAATDFVYGTVRDVPNSAAVSRSSTGEPSVGNMGNTIFYTGNWYAALSTDGGQAFSYVNPSTTFPSINGGFCCDQLVNFAPNQNMMLWAIQYQSDGTAGTLRLARAVGTTSVANNSWIYYDFNPQKFGFPSGDWLDFPGLTFGSTYVYLTSNVFDSGDHFAGSVIWRIPLSEVAAGGNISYTFLKRTDAGSLRLTEGAGATMYWATHLSSSKIRIFHWDDGSSNISWDDVNVNSYTPLSQDGIATSPDGTNFAARSDSRILGGWVAGGVIGFMWGAKQDSTFPYPYVTIARFNQSSRALISQNQIWSSQTAWLFPTASVNGAGNLAGLMVFGGGTYYPSSAIWISDDVQNGFNPLATYAGTQSTSGPTRNRWGDYHTVHPHKDSPNTWVASTYYLQNGGDNSNAVPRYLWFGRERDFSCTFSLSSSSQSFGSSGGTGSVTATASTGSCPRNSNSNDSWIQITSGANGTGSGTIGYSVAANPFSTARAGSMSIAGRNFTVNQSASSCTYNISPSSNSVASGGGSGSVSVTAGAGCAWTAVSNNSFITVTSGSSGTGNGSVGYSVTSNSSSVSRTGTLTIAGKTFTVTQAGVATCIQTGISLGQNLNGSLSGSDCQLTDGSYYDTYSFSGSAGQQVVITMSSDLFDTYLFILKPDGSVLSSDDDGGGGTNSRIPANSGSLVLPSAGTYKILANSFYPGVSGAYSVSLTAASNCTSTPLSVGQSANGALSTTDCQLGDGSYYDTYTFSGLSGQKIVISMSSSTFDTYLLLQAPDNSFLAFDDDGGGGTNSRIPSNSGSYVLPANGTYKVLANSYAAGVTGGYSLTITATRTRTGVFRPSTGELFLKNSNSSGFADTYIIFGNPGDYPIAGDWNGDGIDSVGIYRNGVFYLRNTNSTGFADIVVPFGNPGDQPVVGDWNGDGMDTIGVYRNGTFILRNSNTAGQPDLVFTLGNPGDVGIAGDWNGDGVTTCGVFRPSNGIVYLKNSNTTGFADLSFVFGNAGDKPVAGDWNGDGVDTIGIYRNGVFYLSNSNATGFADVSFVLGNSGDFPIAGNWNGTP